MSMRQSRSVSEARPSARTVRLRDLATAQSLFYGVAVETDDLKSDPEFAACVARDCGILVPMSALKWRVLRPCPDKYDFSDADYLADFAKQHEMLFRGHPLIWHESLPTWVRERLTKATAEQLLIDHIKHVVGHFAGYIHSWDVVNESIWLSGGEAQNLCTTPWQRFLGTEYIQLAFHTAHSVDPNALLGLNEFCYFGPDPRMYDAILNLLDKLITTKTPIHYFGMQAHLRSHELGTAPNIISNFIRSVGALGLKVIITELDVDDRSLPANFDDRDRAVGDIYENFMSMVLSEPATMGIITWGLSDRYSWLNIPNRWYSLPRQDGLPQRPLPLDIDLQPKPAWYALARAFGYRG
jgi:endo-1,4-beta-xylanase